MTSAGSDAEDGPSLVEMFETHAGNKSDKWSHYPEMVVSRKWWKFESGVISG